MRQEFTAAARRELVERSFAHCYETGGMRRCHLRGHKNILKRQLVHVGAINLSLILRKLLGAGTPREWKNRSGGLVLTLHLHVSDKSKAALQKPNLCIRCPVHREIAHPTTSPDLHEIRYLGC